MSEDSVSAVDRTLATPELLEYILLHLSMQDVLLAQRVSQNFHATIIGSPLLQELLFFRATKDTFQSTTDEPSREVYENPLLQLRFWPWYTVNHRAPWELWRSDVFDALHWSLNSKNYEAYAREDASWRNMLVAVPPVKILRVWKITSCNRSGDSIAEGFIQYDKSQTDGLRMGTLYDLTARHIILEDENGDTYCTDTRGFGTSIEPAKLNAVRIVQGQAVVPPAAAQVMAPVPGESAQDQETTAEHDPKPSEMLLVLHETEVNHDITTKEWGLQFLSEGRKRVKINYVNITPPSREGVDAPWTWEGLQAAQLLARGKEGIHTRLARRGGGTLGMVQRMNDDNERQVRRTMARSTADQARIGRWFRYRSLRARLPARD